MRGGDRLVFIASVAAKRVGRAELGRAYHLKLELEPKLNEPVTSGSIPSRGCDQSKPTARLELRSTQARRG
jgi:hypothetical protein